MRSDDAGAWLVTAAGRERLFQATVDHAARRFRAAAVLLLNHDPGELPVSHGRGASERFIKERVRLWQRTRCRRPQRQRRLRPAAARDRFARSLLIPFGYDACITSEIAVPPSQRHRGGKLSLELYFAEPGRANVRLAAEIGAWTRSVAAAFADRFERDALQRENRELLTLAAVSQLVAASLDTERVFETIYAQLLRLVKPRNMLLALAEPEQRRFREVFVYEHGKRGKPSVLPMGPGLATLVWQRKRAIMTSDYPAECRRRRVRPAGAPAKGWLGVPLLGGDGCLGVLLMWDPLRGDSFCQADVRIVQHLANQAVTAVTNARVHERNRRQLAEISAINKIGQAIAKVMTLDRLWPLLHRQLQQLMDARNFYIALYHPAARQLEFVYDLQQGKVQPVETRRLARGLTEYVIASRRPLLLADPGQRVPSANYRMIGKRAQSWLGVPILSQGAVLGVMAIQNYRQPHCYDAHHQELLEIVAGQVSVAIENTRLYQAAQRRVTELSALRQVNEAAVTGTDIDQVLKRILTIIKDQLGGLNCAILMPDESRSRLYIRQALGYSGRAVRDIRLAIGREGITGRVAQTGTTVYVPDVRADQRYVQSSARCRSELAIPLLAGGVIVGVLDIERAQVDGFSPADIGLFENLAKQAALVIAKVRSEESSRLRIRELSTLFTMFQSFSIGIDFHELCGKIAEKIGLALGAQKCLIALIDQAGTEVTGVAGYLAGQLSPRQTARFATREALARSLRFKLSKGGVAPRVIGSGQPYLTNDARRDPVILRRFAEEFEITRLIVLPLSTRGKALGLAYVADPAGGRAFHDDDVRLAKALAGQAALIMDNARLYHEMGQGLKQVTTLYQMSQAITQASSLPDVLDLAVTIIGQLVPADYLSIMLWDPSKQWLAIKAARGLDERTVRNARFRPGQGLAGWVAQHGQPVITEDLRRDPRFQSIGQAEDIGPAISVPLLSGDKVLGVLNIDNRASHRAAFTQEHLQLALTMGSTIALAIERAELVASLDGRVSVQKALMETGTLLLSSLEFRAVLEKIASEIQKLIPFLALAIYAVDWDKRQLQPIMARGPFESEMLNDLPFSMDSGITGAIARSGAPEIVNDTNSDPRAVHIEGTSDESQNLMAVPFVVQGRAAAVLALWRDLGHVFTAAELEVAALFANQAAVALNNARLFEEIRSNEKEVADTNNRLNLALKRQIEVNTELSTLQYLSSTILSSLKLEEILSVIVEGIRSSLGFDSVLISLVDRSGQYLEHKAASGFAADVHERLMRQRPGLHEYLPLMRPEHRISNSYFWSKEAEVTFTEIARPAGDPRPAAGRWHPDDKLLIPLHSKEKELLAIIQVGKPVNEAVPDKKKVRSLEAFANTAVLAIENATLYQQAQSRINELSLLYDIGIVVTSVLETGKLLDSVVRVIREKLHYLKVAVLMVDAQTRSIYTGSQVGFDEDQHVEYRSVGGDSLAGQVAERGEPMVVSEAHKDPRYVAVDDRVHSAVAVPIKREGRVVGILNIEDARPNAFGDSDVKLLTTLASQVSVALDNARLYEEAKRQINELSVLHDVSTTVGSTLKVEALLSQVCQILQETFRYPKISILLTDQERRQLELVASRGYRPGDQKLGKLLRIGQDGVTGMVAATGEPIIIEDVTTSSQYISIDGNTRSEIAVPLKLGGQMIGVINVESDNLGAFGSLDLRLLTTLAAQVAVAVENARLYEQTEQLAVTDGLTGIFNHRYFHDFFERELNRAKRYRHSLSLIMLDIDHFKQVNDRHGHPTGDRVLQQVAAVLRTQARDVDLVARYGGEEFMVVLPETRKREAMILANRIRVQVRDITFKDEHDRDLDRITVSLGVASFPEDGGTKSDLIDYVDKALYRSKAAGRDQVTA